MKGDLSLTIGEIEEPACVEDFSGVPTSFEGEILTRFAKNGEGQGKPSTHMHCIGAIVQFMD